MVKVLLKNNKNDQFRFMLNEAAKVQRTIDPKLWASVQSACSRKYKDTLGEDAVPPVKDDKDTLLARYVAGLIILKQPCPESLSDIDKIGAFKQFGHKLINVFGCSLYDIQVLYNENRGNLPAVKVDNELSQSFDNDANITRSEEEIERIKKEQDDLDKELAAKDMSNTKEIKDLDKHVQASKEKEFDNTRYSETDLAAAKNRVVQNQARSRNSMPNTDVSRIDKVEMNIDGKKQTIYPHRIAMLTESYLNDMLNNPDTKVFKKYFDKPIIWTFEIETAATDGIRIFFNPGFADKLFSMDGEVMQRKKQLGHDTSGILGHSIQFVVIHEAYHQIYQHFIREQMKPETSGKPELHGLANIAQDVEINRDIENQIPMFYGMTKTIGGCFDTRFPTEAWE